MPKSPTSSQINALYTPEACEQRRVRMRLTVAAVAYEFYSESIMSDGDFDALSLKVDTSVDTGYPELDWFFSEHFHPSTGMWIHQHPHLPQCKAYYEHLKRIGTFDRPEPVTEDPENPYGI